MNGTRSTWRVVGISALVVIALAIAAASIIVMRKGWQQTITALPHLPVGCPQGLPALLVIGQSQASNTGEERRIPSKTAYAFADGECFKVRDPMPGTGGRSGSIWPSFVDALDRPVVIANLAISGTAINEWTDGQALARVRTAIRQLNDAGYAKPIVIWMQGETDGQRRTSADTYLRQLQTLITVAPDAPWLITRESICYDKQDKWQPLDDARGRFASMHPNVTIGPDLDAIPVTQRQADHCHLKVAGQDRLARELAVAVTPLLPK